MDPKIGKVIAAFSQERPMIEAVYLAHLSGNSSRIYFYVPGYRYDSVLQNKITELNIALNKRGEVPLMAATFVSPADAQKQGHLEEIIYQREKTS